MTSIPEADPALLEMYQNEPAKRAEVLRRTVARSEILLKQFCHPWVESLPKVRYLVSTGNAFDLTRHACRTGVKRTLIGNVVEKVVRHAPCPF